ncbi:MAG: septum site-determining protein Ssd [Actinomycetes bacterium]
MPEISVVVPSGHGLFGLIHNGELRPALRFDVIRRWPPHQEVVVFVPEPPASQGRASRPLVVTADGVLRDELVRLVAAAGADAVVLSDAAAVRAVWSAAPFVLVGADAAAHLTQAGLPPRPQVAVVTFAPPGVDDYSAALTLGAEDVIDVSASANGIVHRIADAVEGDDAAAEVLGVIGGRGGAGATTLSAALALAARRAGLRTMLVDADPLGGGIDLALGAERLAGLRWDDLAGTAGRLSAAALRESLLHVHELTVLSWGRAGDGVLAASAMHAALRAGRRAHDLLVVDVGRHLDGAARAALEHVDRLLVVVPAEVRAAAAARRLVTTISLLVAEVGVVVRGPAPTSLTASAIAATLGLPLLGEFRSEPKVAFNLDRGEPPGADGRGQLARFAAELLTVATRQQRRVA